MDMDFFTQHATFFVGEPAAYAELAGEIGRDWPLVVVAADGFGPGMDYVFLLDERRRRRVSARSAEGLFGFRGSYARMRYDMCLGELYVTERCAGRIILVNDSAPWSCDSDEEAFSAWEAGGMPRSGLEACLSPGRTAVLDTYRKPSEAVLGEEFSLCREIGPGAARTRLERDGAAFGWLSTTEGEFVFRLDSMPFLGRFERKFLEVPWRRSACFCEPPFLVRLGGEVSLSPGRYFLGLSARPEAILSEEQMARRMADW